METDQNTLDSETKLMGNGIWSAQRLSLDFSGKPGAGSILIPLFPKEHT